ncbi:MAG: hypothetical protein WC523_03870 [Patescibacteria group bacterium]
MNEHHIAKDDGLDMMFLVLGLNDNIRVAIHTNSDGLNHALDRTKMSTFFEANIGSDWGLVFVCLIDCSGDGVLLFHFNFLSLLNYPV